MRDILIRDARDDDGDDLIALIETCWADYPGCFLDVDDENPELRNFASFYRNQRGRAWIAELRGQLVGSAAVEPVAGRFSKGAHIQTLYVNPSVRRQGLARRLIALVEDHAMKYGAKTIDLWTDTRFTEAHAFYERHGYRRQPGTRHLDDKSSSVEYNYVKTLQP